VVSRRIRALRTKIRYGAQYGLSSALTRHGARRIDAVIPHIGGVDPNITRVAIPQNRPAGIEDTRQGYETIIAVLNKPELRNPAQKRARYQRTPRSGTSLNPLHVRNLHRVED